MHKLSSSRISTSMLCGLAIAGAFLLNEAKADEATKRTILTVSQTVQIGDAVLQPGQYVIKLLDSQSERHVVQIFNRAQTHIIQTVVAVPVERVVPRGRTAFTFYETPAGAVRALRTWYYPGDSYGQQFPYPKRHEMLAAGASVVEGPLAFSEETPAPSEPATQASNEQPASTPPPAEEPTADRPAEATQPAQIPAQTPPQTEVAQNATAPASDTAAESPSPGEADRSATELPQTGSSYPEIGLLGLLLLGLGGAIRVTRRA
jgi:LPXTG-motif cell wall-anchored protein